MFRTPTATLSTQTTPFPRHESASQKQKLQPGEESSPHTQGESGRARPGTWWVRVQGHTPELGLPPSEFSETTHNSYPG